MTHDEAVSKAVRLLRLAQSDNPHEAALAAAKAQEIIDRYKLTGITEESSIPVVEEPIRDFEAPLDGTTGNMARWRVMLASTLAKANQSRVYTWTDARGKSIKIVGRPSDAETIRYLYQYLTREIERLASLHAKGNGKTWANNFRLGIVDEIGDRLREQREATVHAVKQETANTSALVRVDQALAKMEKQAGAVADWMKENLKLKKTYSQTRYDDSARMAGRRAGKSINLGSGRAMTSGAKALGSGQ